MRFALLQSGILLIACTIWLILTANNTNPHIQVDIEAKKTLFILAFLWGATGLAALIEYGKSFAKNKENDES